MGLFDFLKGKEPPNPETALGSPAAGTYVPMEQIPDEVFSQGVMGVCCGVEPSEGKVYAPVDGTISQLTDTLHALGISAGRMEILVHVGVDTVEMRGDGFTNTVREGQAVKKGDLLITMDLEKIRAAGHPATVILAVTNSDDFPSVTAAAAETLRPGDTVLLVRE